MIPSCYWHGVGGFVFNSSSSSESTPGDDELLVRASAVLKSQGPENWSHGRPGANSTGICAGIPPQLSPATNTARRSSRAPVPSRRESESHKGGPQRAARSSAGPRPQLERVIGAVPRHGPSIFRLRPRAARAAGVKSCPQWAEDGRGQMRRSSALAGARSRAPRRRRRDERPRPRTRRATQRRHERGGGSARSIDRGGGRSRAAVFARGARTTPRPSPVARSRVRPPPHG